MARQPLDLRKKNEAPVRRAAPSAPEPRTPLRETKRATPLRVRKRRKRYAGGALVVLLIGAALYGIHWVSYLPQYTIQTINVSGTAALTQDDIRGRIEQYYDSQRGFVSPRSIFRYHGAGVVQLLQTDILHIAHASVSHPSLLSTELDVTIVERTPFARWCASDTQCFLIDQTGFIFAADDGSAQPPEPLVFSGGVSDPNNPLGHYVAVARFPSALSLARALGQAGFAPHDISIDSDTDLTVRLQNSFAVHASFGADPNALVRDLKLILASDPLKGHESDIEYIDLRFGNRIFYKLQGQEAVGE